MVTRDILLRKYVEHYNNGIKNRPKSTSLYSYCEYTRKITVYASQNQIDNILGWRVRMYDYKGYRCRR